jgi:1-deoxy-D-xylulose-5-phosphate synthase
VRFPRGNCPTQETLPEGERRGVQPGKAEVLREGERAVIWAYGVMASTALEVAARLERRGVSVGVVDARWLKPLDEELLAEHARRYRHIVTLEDSQRAGGFGSAVLEAWSRLPLHGADDARPARVRVLGVPDRFIEHMTSREEQLASVGLDPDGVERSLLSLLAPALVR